MNLADKISALRIALVPVFVSLLVYSCSTPFLINIAVAVFILAVLSDFLDGLVARIRKEKSDIGQIIDPVADKLFLFASFFSLYLLRDSLPLAYKMPLGIVLAAAGRDVVVLSGLLTLYILKKDVNIAPSVWGKLTTFFQMLTVLMLFLNISWFIWVCRIAVIFTIISGIGYFIRGVKAGNDHTVSG
ncbi:MAG: CDP-alcohol phosphatidyltransferase family protein [Candidatus Omnitrophica bacterium]|nr:CDP-alcohol phosphatidyltransferase family protein [Candidatus Omnitrophota bacterium]